MQIYIDGENCRKGLVRVLQNSKIINNSREMTKYRFRTLLKDVLDTNGNLDIKYYVSKIKLPYGYTPSTDIILT